MKWWFKRQKIDLPAHLVDLHCHIIPDIDDGSVDEDESLQMLRLFVEQGYEILVSTSHLGHPLFPEVSVEVIRQGIQTLEKIVEEYDLPLKIYMGAEIYYSDFFLDELANNRLVKLGNNGTYMLIEFPPRDPLSLLKQLVFDLGIKGIQPVLAHPERYDILLRRPKLAREWVNAGWILQLDLPSLINENGPAVRKLAFRFLNEGLYDLAASDLHHAEPTKNLEKMLQVLIKKVGYEETERLVSTNPRLMVEGKPIVENRED